MPVVVPPPSDAAIQYPALAELIRYLQTLTGRAELGTLDRLLRSLSITRSDIEAACTFGVRGYRRNIISASPHYELLALCWRSGHCTPIHDHMGSSCAFRVVEGTGSEIAYRPTPSGKVVPTHTNVMQPGYICAANDADIHQVANLQAPGEDLITLHIYSPAIERMNVYHTAQPVESLNVYGSNDDGVAI